jgi:hypothetical protein
VCQGWFVVLVIVHEEISSHHGIGLGVVGISVVSLYVCDSRRRSSMWLTIVRVPSQMPLRCMKWCKPCGIRVGIVPVFDEVDVSNTAS